MVMVSPEDSEGSSGIGISSVVPTTMGTSGDNIDSKGTRASNGKLGDTSHEQPDGSSKPRRSIFGSYWQHGDHKNTKEDRTAPQQSQTLSRSKSPRCVLRHPHVQVYACPDQSILGKQQQQGESRKIIFGVDGHGQEGTSDQEVTPSENASRLYKSRPLSLASMWSSLPAMIFMDERFKVLSPRPIKSDPALGSKNLKSNLRKGRFSGSSVPRNTRSKDTNVTFQPLIKVHPFEPPMDRWAESGWSKQFDS